MRTRQLRQMILPSIPYWVPCLRSRKFTLMPHSNNGRPVRIQLGRYHYVLYRIVFHPGESRGEIRADVVEDKLYHAGFSPVSDQTMEKLKARFPIPKGFPRIFTFGKGRNRQLTFISYTPSGWIGGKTYFSQRLIRPSDLFLMRDDRDQP